MQADTTVSTMSESIATTSTMDNPQSDCFNEQNGRSARPALILGIPNENPQQGNANGSLPGSPESDCGELGECALPERMILERDTPEIVGDFLLSFTGLPRHGQMNKTHGKVLETMKRVVDSLLVKHELVYKGIIEKLCLDDQGDDMSVITTVAQEMFSDGVTNWGRIASLLAFGAVVSLHQKDRGRGNCVSLVGEKISSYFLFYQHDWLLKNKAWEGFVNFFHVPDPESKVRNTLMAFVTLAGLGAGLALLTR